MTGRERLTAIMDRQPVDRLAWTVLVDDHTLRALPGRLRDLSGIEFSRHLGCDILQLEGWGTDCGFASPALEWGPEVQEATYVSGDEHVRELRTERGTLTSVWRRSHPQRFFVESLEDLRVYRSAWEGARFVARDDRPAFERVNALVGDEGIVTRFWGPSPVPRLLECDLGLEAFYYLLHDHAAEMEALLALMDERFLEAYAALAQDPCDVVMLVENTSTTYISPEVYRRYSGPHVGDFVRTMQAAGKRAIIHMCGHVRGLLPDIGETALDGIHALTPPPTGDTPWELALDALGEDTIICGVLDPTVFALGPVEAIGLALDRLYTPRLRGAPVILLVAADGIEVPLERFEAVARWMERNGQLR